jgi:hypothetical protein
VQTRRHHRADTGPGPPGANRYKDAQAAWQKLDSAGADLVPKRFCADGSGFPATCSASGEAPSLIKRNLATGARATLSAGGPIVRAETMRAALVKAGRCAAVQYFDQFFEARR